MVGHAAHGELDPVDALHARHRADGVVLVLQHRPLFHVQFDKGVHLVIAYRSRPGIADAGQVLAHRGAVYADRGQRILQGQVALVHQAAHHVRRKARAFLVGEERHRYRSFSDHARVVQGRDHFQPGQHPQVAVIAAAGAHRVDVRPRHHRRTGLATSTQAHHVADAVHRHGQAQFAHPLHHQIASLPVRVRQRQAADAPALDGADLRQVGDAAQQPGAVDPHSLAAGLKRGASHATASASTSAALLPTMR